MIAHNAVAFFHDGISVCTHGVPEPEPELKAVAIDIYNNDVHVTGDDFIEADGGVHNIRVMRNRGVNAAHTGLSAQPIFGGPAYYIRNVVYNTPVALKFINPAGVIVYHNTIVAENRTAQRVSNAHFRTTCSWGPMRRSASRPGRPHGATRPTTTTAIVRTAARSPSITWLGPKPGVQVDYDDRAEPGAAVQDARGAGGRDRSGDPRDRDRLRHLREPAPPVPPDSSKPGTPYDAVGR